MLLQLSLPHNTLPFERLKWVFITPVSCSQRENKRKKNGLMCGVKRTSDVGNSNARILRYHWPVISTSQGLRVVGSLSCMKGLWSVVPWDVKITGLWYREQGPFLLSYSMTLAFSLVSLVCLTSHISQKMVKFTHKESTIFSAPAKRKIWPTHRCLLFVKFVYLWDAKLKCKLFQHEKTEDSKTTKMIIPINQIENGEVHFHWK